MYLIGNVYQTLVFINVVWIFIKARIFLLYLWGHKWITVYSQWLSPEFFSFLSTLNLSFFLGRGYWSLILWCSYVLFSLVSKDEKPVTNSMLGVWIGDTAIPCTPSVAKEKSRVKISCTKWVRISPSCHSMRQIFLLTL